MASNVLVTYATHYGSTREVAEAIAAALREKGVAVDRQLARDVRNLDGVGAVVLGAPLIMYHWHSDTLRFLSRHRRALESRPVALFVLGPTHVPHDEAEWADSRAQIDKELAKYPWLKPVAVQIMGGKFDPKALRFPLNMLAGSEPATDIRDWEAIRAWAAGLAPLLMR